MRVSNLLPLLCLAGFVRAQNTPIEVPGRLVVGVWSIVGKLDGKPARFLIDTGDPWSMVRTKDQQGAARTAQLELGSFKKSFRPVFGADPLFDTFQVRLDIERIKTPSTVSILGMDLWSRHPIGFDYGKSTVTIWPEGPLDGFEAQKWISDAADVVILPLEHLSDARLGVDLKFGTETVRLGFDTGADSGLLDSTVLKKIASTVAYTKSGRFADGRVKSYEVRLVPKVLVREVAIPWWTFMTEEGFKAPEPDYPEGVISMNDLRSSRVLLDVGGGKVYFRRPGATAALNAVLQNMTGVPVSITGDTVRLDARSHPFYRNYSQYQGHEIVSIAGISTKTILMALRSSDSESGKTLARLMNISLAGVSIVVADGAKTVTIP
jgi:hypothetical protein